MSKTEYYFDGLDEFEKQLSKLIEQEYPREFKAMVVQLAYELQASIKEKTPKSKNLKKTGSEGLGGHLQESWVVGDIIKRGNEYYIEVSNNVEYAEYVEYGHRTRGGKGFVKGAHMMELSLKELNERLPDFLRDWLSVFISTHDL